MKIAVVGSREFKDKQIVIQKLTNFIKRNDIIKLELVSGRAKGVDTWAERVFKNYNKHCVIFRPDWNKYGKSAGYLRNKLIINEADKCIAFWDGKSKGTKHSIDLAIKKGIPVDIYIR